MMSLPRLLSRRQSALEPRRQHAPTPLCKHAVHTGTRRHACCSLCSEASVRRAFCGASEHTVHLIHSFELQYSHKPLCSVHAMPATAVRAAARAYDDAAQSSLLHQLRVHATSDDITLQMILASRQCSPTIGGVSRRQMQSGVQLPPEGLMIDYVSSCEKKLNSSIWHHDPL
jgi:hypothetical protein